MNPSTSLGTRSKVGMAKPSPPIRQAGNIGHLLVIRGVYRRSLRSTCAHVTYRCRCRALHLRLCEALQIHVDLVQINDLRIKLAPYPFELIPIKSLAATGSTAPGSCAGHSRAPSPDHGPLVSTGGAGPARGD